MSAMSDMLGDMLKKAIPPEVAAMLTPENMNAIGEKANAFIAELRSTLSSIEETQSLILKRIERIENGGSDSNNGGLIIAPGSADNGDSDNRE